MTRIILTTLTFLTIFVSNADARHLTRHHHHLSFGGGHFICGLTQRLYFGIKDTSLNLALEWKRKFPHVAAAPGMVVVQHRRGHALGGGPGGHVSRIVSLVGACRAIVADEKGTYERDICKNGAVYVNPHG